MNIDIHKMVLTPVECAYELIIAVSQIKELEDEDVKDAIGVVHDKKKGISYVQLQMTKTPEEYREVFDKQKFKHVKYDLQNSIVYVPHDKPLRLIIPFTESIAEIIHSEASKPDFDIEKITAQDISDKYQNLFLEKVISHFSQK